MQELEAKQQALKLSLQDGLPNDAYVALYNKRTDDFVIYPRVSTLLFKVAKTGSYAGKAMCDLVEDSGKVISAQTTVSRLVMDSIQTFEGDTVYFDEYATNEWHHKKPRMFLSKIALAVALRQAFPDVVAGLISYEEARCELEFKTDRVVTKQSLDMPKTPDSVKSIVEKVFK